MRKPEITHKIMSSIKSQDTVPELLLRKELWRRGYRYRVHTKGILGKPDITIKKYKVAIFCDGDFWHGHNWAIRGMGCFDEELKRYNSFWQEKITRNTTRDKKITEELEKDGWIVMRFWESDIKKSASDCVDKIEKILQIIKSSQIGNADRNDIPKSKE